MKSFQRQPVGRPGFTMLEVLLALVILAMISMTLWTTFNNSFRMRDRLEAVEERTSSVRTLLAKMGRDIEMAFVVKEKKLNSRFLGKDEGALDSLTFSTFSNVVFYDQMNQSDQSMVSYYTLPNRNEPALVDVYRWSFPYIEDDQYWGEKRGVKIYEGVKRFDLTYFNGEEYKALWDNEQLEFNGKIPQAVKLVLELADERVIENIFTVALPAALGATPLKGPVAVASPTATGTPSATPTPAAPVNPGSDE